MYINPYQLFTGAIIPNWLMKREEISFGAKICYARLCQYAGKAGIARPSQLKIAEEIGCKARNFRYLVEELEKAGLIEVIQVGKKQANRYKFLMHKWMEIGEWQDSASHSESVWQDSATPMDRQDFATPYEENQEENQLPLKSPKVWELFETFWRVYPRRTGRGAAEKAFEKAIKIIPAEKLLRAVGNYARASAHKDPRFIPHPATWLNQKRWLDEPEKDPPTITPFGVGG